MGTNGEPEKNREVGGCHKEQSDHHEYVEMQADGGEKERLKEGAEKKDLLRN